MRSFWYDNPGHLSATLFFPSESRRSCWDRGPWIDYPGRSLSLSFNIGFWSPLIGSLVESIECSVNTRADYAQLSRPTVLPTSDSFYALISAVVARDSMIYRFMEQITNVICTQEENSTLWFDHNWSTTNRMITCVHPYWQHCERENDFFFLNYSYCRWRVVGRKLSGPGSFPGVWTLSGDLLNAIIYSILQ